ncbi:MAG: glycogen debranching protein GlgX [bacterium]|nr:glycogen debranching protein GlgX [bacterium]
MKLVSYVGDPRLLGVSRTRKGHNFAIFSDQAAGITLNLFEGDSALAEIPLSPTENRTGVIWHIELFGLPEEFTYSYRITATNAAKQPFDPDVELIDPYALALSGLERWGQRNERPIRGVFGDTEFDWQGDKPLGRPLKDTLIYELHLRGFTQHESSGVKHPGTYLGVIEKIPYLKELGITAVELMPIHEFDETDNPFINPATGERLKNYWGYASLNFFSVKAAYGSDGTALGALREFKEMVRELHRAGIEVILDVVYNHTAEGGQGGRIYNFKGLSNQSYYIFDEAGHYANYSGCGNTLNCNHPVVRRMIMDSLNYFVSQCHVDGFRFDLASILSRDETGTVLTSPPVLDSIAKDPILSHTKIIAEAWDAMGLYQVGSFPASGRWAEWNGRYRDCLRAFVRGERHRTAEVATRITGSEDLYGHSQRNPYHSINFITSHDGFTLADLVSFERKHNQANGESNRDGDNHNLSQNFGVEGPTPRQDVMELRHRQLRNLLTLLFISQGTPMLPMGDECGRSQQGNNNAWAQDNAISWMDWTLVEKNTEQLAFVRALVALRKEHPNLRRESFFDGQVNRTNGLPDLSWHAQRAWEPEFDHGNNKLAFLVNAFEGSHRVDDFIYVAMNFEREPKYFELPSVSAHSHWLEVLDSFRPQPFIEGRRSPFNGDARSLRLEPLSVRIFLGQ